jgi:uncharacterized protein
MTPRSAERLTVPGQAGPIEVVRNVPGPAVRGVALVCHPHPLQGGTLDNKVVQTLARTFFGLGTFDEGNGETDDALAVLADTRARFGDSLPVALAGFSFGSYVQTRVAERVASERLVLVAPAVRRFAVGAVAPESIVNHGDEDDVVPLADVLAWARPQQLPIVVFPGCGHFFHGRLPQLSRIVAALWPAKGAEVGA